MQALCLKKTILITSVSNFELRCEISSTVQNSSYIFRKTNFYMLTQGEVSKFESTLSTVQNVNQQYQRLTFFNMLYNIAGSSLFCLGIKLIKNFVSMGYFKNWFWISSIKLPRSHWLIMILLLQKLCIKYFLIQQD